MDKINFQKYHKALKEAAIYKLKGKIVEARGLIVKALIKGVKIGEICLIYRDHNSEPIEAEVVGFKDNLIYLMPYGDITNIGLDCEVISTGSEFNIKISEALKGRILNGKGKIIDGKEEIIHTDAAECIVSANSPPPLTRKRIIKPMEIGIKAIDALLTIGEGQRVGIFSAAGVGKSTLLGMIAKNACADINVIGLIGERGREVKEFIEDNLTSEALLKSIIVVATSDEPAIMRLKAAYVATTIAEYFREKGEKVILLIDSITRFARAQREIGLAIGEIPARQGFTPSVFSALPKLMERAGNSSNGSITAFYTVLVEGDDLTEPISDEALSILDGHIVLSRELASECHYPAIDILRSISRVMDNIISPEHKILSNKIKKILDTYEKVKDLILIGAYKKGSEPEIDYALSKIHKIKAFLKQNKNEKFSFAETLKMIKLICD